MIERSDRHCDATIQQLEARHSVFASRARDVAHRMLREPLLQISHPPTVIDAENDASAENDTDGGEDAEVAEELKEVSSPPLATQIPVNSNLFRPRMGLARVFTTRTTLLAENNARGEQVEVAEELEEVSSPPPELQSR